MKKLIYLIFLTGATVLVSFKGGNISYMLFYFALILPVLALLYSVYVYCRFKIVQEVARTVVKAEEVPYRLILANEDLIPFTDITLHYFSEMVTVADCADTHNLSLLAHTDIRVDTRMYCKYRGTYPVGVKSVSVTDFLGLFTITYPMKSQIRLTARPRILPTERFASHPPRDDPKTNLFTAAKLQNLPDFELRRYYPGDSTKYIHWKNSAKTGELMVRKQMPEELSEIIICMDLSPIAGNRETSLEKEDNIIEAAIAFAYDYYLKHISVHMIFAENDGRLKEFIINSSVSFDGFYEKCANLPFTASLPPEKVLTGYIGRSCGSRSILMITSSVTGALNRCIENRRRSGHEIALIHTGELSL